MYLFTQNYFQKILIYVFYCMITANVLYAAHYHNSPLNNYAADHHNNSFNNTVSIIIDKLVDPTENPVPTLTIKYATQVICCGNCSYSKEIINNLIHCKSTYLS